MVYLVVLLLLLCSFCCTSSLGGELGDEISWKTYEDGIMEIQKVKKPGMIVFHRDYSNSCVRLGEEMRGYERLIKRSKKFVMISCNGDNDPQSEIFEYGKYGYFN